MPDQLETASRGFTGLTFGLLSVGVACPTWVVAFTEGISGWWSLLGFAFVFATALAAFGFALRTLFTARRRIPRYRTGALLGSALAISGLFLGLKSVGETIQDRVDRSRYTVRQIGYAMHNYEGTHGRLPPAAVYDPEGRPLLSWRVLILPALGRKQLYDQFKLSEPWDSEHNIRLLERMPSVYQMPRRMAKNYPPHHTICHVFVGKGTAFESRKGEDLYGFTDDPGCIVLVVEAGEPVPWTKPDNLVFDPNGPLPELKHPFKEGFRVCMADGSVHFVKAGTTEATIKAAITRSGGETLGPDW